VDLVGAARANPFAVKAFSFFPGLRHRSIIAASQWRGDLA
jgi:hypothetical protein